MVYMFIISFHRERKRECGRKGGKLVVATAWGVIVGVRANEPAKIHLNIVLYPL